MNQCFLQYPNSENIRGKVFGLGKHIDMAEAKIRH
jgi:hypothetical protein